MDNPSASKPLTLPSESRPSVAASEDYYSPSEQTEAHDSAGRAVIARCAAPSSYLALRTPPPSRSPSRSRSHAAAEMAASRREPSAPFHLANSDCLTENAEYPGRSRSAHVILPSDPQSRRESSGLSATAPTPNVDDSLHIRFALDQLTCGEDHLSVERQHSPRDADYSDKCFAWDETLGYFVRLPRVLAQHLSQPSLRAIQGFVGPELFVPVEPQEENLLHPSLDFVPVALQPTALTAAIFCCLLMIAGITFCNSWSQHHDGLWDYNGRGTLPYFVFQFLPQILAAIIIIWTFIIQAAVYRTIPFAIMASDRPLDRVLQSLPLHPQNFVLPDILQFRHGESVMGISLLVIWFSNFITIPLLSCLFQARHYEVNGEGIWRWAAVQAVGWTIVAVYGLLVVGIAAILARFAHAWTGLMWDPVCLADIVPIVQRSNILHGLEHSELVCSTSKSMKPRILRLGYWKTSHNANIFYGIGEAEAPVRSPSLHQMEKTIKIQPSGISQVLFDVQRQSFSEDELFRRDLFSLSVRHQWIHWFLQRNFVAAWIVSSFALLVAFLLVSFLHHAIQNGFRPRLPTLPAIGWFSSSNFLYSFIPSQIGTILFLLWQPVDTYYRAAQPFVELSSPNGAPPEKSLLLSYQSLLPFEVSVSAFLNGHYQTAWISLMSTISVAIPILAGGVFIALWYPSEDEIRIAPCMPAFYTLAAFCALYAVSSPCIWPSRLHHLPHSISTLADLTSFFYQSPLLYDRVLREPRSKADLSTRLVAIPPGDAGCPMYGFGVYVGRDGKEHFGIDRFYRPGRADMLTVTG